MATIAEQLVAARKAKNMTQGALAQALNVSRVSISNWETGRRTPNAETVLRMSRILDYSFERENTHPRPAQPAWDDALHAPEIDLPLDGQSNAPDEPLPLEGQPDEPDEPLPLDGQPDAPDEPLPPDGQPDAPDEPLSPDAPTPDAPQPSPPAPAPQPRRWVVPVAVAAALALALCAWRFLLPAPGVGGRPVPPASAEVTAETATKAYFQQDNVNAPDKPYLSIEAVLNSDVADMWMYTVRYHETNGFAFNIDRIESFAFMDGSVRSIVVDRDALEQQGYPTRIEARGDWSVEGGMPARSSSQGAGFVLRGTDDSGVGLSFVFYLPLTA